MEATDAKDLIEEAIERSELKNEEVEKAERSKERMFRERVSLMVGGFAVALAVIHMAAAGAQRESVLNRLKHRTVLPLCRPRLSAKRCSRRLQVQAALLRRIKKLGRTKQHAFERQAMLATELGSFKNWGQNSTKRV